MLLIDEIDGISDRSTLSGEYTEYWLQIVNCLLECMSGVVDNAGVCIIATTNFPERVDAALRRASRLDREILLKKPGSADLALIFRHYLGEQFLSGVDLTPAGLAADGRTGADVEAYVRRAKAKARRAGRDLELEDLMSQIREGRPAMRPEIKHRVAIHEIGHVLVGRELRVGKAAYSVIFRRVCRERGRTPWARPTRPFFLPQWARATSYRHDDFGHFTPKMWWVLCQVEHWRSFLTRSKPSLICRSFQVPGRPQRSRADASNAIN